jgi:hypothetical protein
MADLRLVHSEDTREENQSRKDFEEYLVEVFVENADLVNEISENGLREFTREEFSRQYLREFDRARKAKTWSWGRCFLYATILVGAIWWWMR